MSGPYPADMGGNDREFSGRWWCEGDGGHWSYEPIRAPITHPFTATAYCSECVEEMKDNGTWPLKCETCDGQGYLQNLLKCPDCKEGWR